MMWHTKRAALSGALIAALLMIAGCDSDQGPAEQAGEKIDETAEEAKDSVEDAVESAGDAVEEGADKVEEETD